MPAVPIGVAAGCPGVIIAGMSYPPWPGYPTPEAVLRESGPSTGRGWALLVAGTVVWVGIVITPGVIAISVARPRNGGIPAHYYSTIWVASAAAVVVTVLEGVLIGFRRLWWGVPAAAALGTVCLAGCYVAAFMVAQPNDPSSDNAAGAGLVIFGVPAFVVLLALIAVGFGITRGAKLVYRTPRFLS